MLVPAPPSWDLPRREVTERAGMDAKASGCSAASSRLFFSIPKDGNQIFAPVSGAKSGQEKLLASCMKTIF